MKHNKVKCLFGYHTWDGFHEKSVLDLPPYFIGRRCYRCGITQHDIIASRNKKAADQTIKDHKAINEAQ